MHSLSGGDVPDVQFIAGSTAFVEHGRTSLPLPNFTTLVAGTHPDSRGQLTPASADPTAPPRIDPAYFSEPADLERIKAGLRVAQEIARQGPIAKYLDAPRLPEGELDDEALTRHARTWAQTEYHAVGTCTMGAGDHTVVDPTLKVNGIDGLRVVDASVMPAITSGNTNGPTIMIAEKGADLIRV